MSNMMSVFQWQDKGYHGHSIHVTILHITERLKKGLPSILPAAPAISSLVLVMQCTIANAESRKNQSGQAGGGGAVRREERD